MTEDQETEPQVFDLEINLPKILTGPITLSDGTTLDVGDKVEHRTFGIGKVRRVSHSEKLGNLVYVDFESGKDEILGVSFVKKVQ